MNANKMKANKIKGCFSDLLYHWARKWTGPIQWLLRPVQDPVQT